MCNNRSKFVTFSGKWQLSGVEKDKKSTVESENW